MHLHDKYYIIWGERLHRMKTFYKVLLIQKQLQIKLIIVLKENTKNATRNVQRYEMRKGEVQFSGKALA